MDGSPTPRAIAIVGLGAILPDAPNAPSFWANVKAKRYSIVDVPPDRWSVAHYYDPDPEAPDKTYSKIGGWVQGFEFDWKRFRVPPKVAAAMDASQQWAVTIAAEALADYGYPERPLDTERTGVIMGTAMGGEMHYRTFLRISFPEYAQMLEQVGEFRQLPAGVRREILRHWHEVMDSRFQPVTEDSMPGELANIVSGRVANVLNLRGPNYIADAACASSFAAINAAVELLAEHHCDAVIAGGVDHNMGAASFVKFCKIGALSATGSRPFGDGADGFVMGEGSGAFLLKRLADAERDGDKIYAVIRGVGGSSDGKGKGITAPNPVGQVLSARRAWQNAGLDPATVTLIEAHGTSTRVGDAVEMESLNDVFGAAPRGAVALGSAKSNIGHLKAGAGAAGLLKAVYAVYDKVLPPTLNCERPNPALHFEQTPFFLNHELREWASPARSPRRAGVSAYGFGGTNFHVVIEEHVPGLTTGNGRKSYAAAGLSAEPKVRVVAPVTSIEDRLPAAAAGKPPVQGILALGAATPAALKDHIDEVFHRIQGGWAPPVQAPDPAELGQPERLVIDFANAGELVERVQKARKALGFDNPAAWKALAAQGMFRGSGEAQGKIAFLFPGQGSQYANMGRVLARREPVVAEVFADADRVMTPILGKPLTEYVFVDAENPAAMKQAEWDLMQTAITQPAVLAMDTAIFRLLGEYGIRPDMVMGHSLGEYGALIAAGVMPFAHALEASAARGSEMTKVSWDDNGWMAAVIGPLQVVLDTLKEVDGYVVPANINSYNQVVIGGASKAVEQAINLFNQKGLQAMRIPVSHAFHTQIVAPACKPFREVLNRLDISSPAIPLVANVTGDIYPTKPNAIRDILEEQVASPVQWVKGLETLYAQGCRAFVEVGPKKALKGFVDDVLGDKSDVVSLFTNHPKFGELPTFNQALCGLYAAGYGARQGTRAGAPIGGTITVTGRDRQPDFQAQGASSGSSAPIPAAAIAAEAATMPTSPATSDVLGQLAQVLQQALQTQPRGQQPFDRNDAPLGSVVVSGTGLGLPGAEKPVMDPDNALRILRGEQFIDLVPERFRHRMLDKRITRVVKADDGGGSFQVITDPEEVIKLAGRPGPFDLAEEYGVPAKLVEALDTTTQLAMAAGFDALREAGIPLVQTFKTTSIGSFLPDRWLLPLAMRDETGVIFASAFPGGDRFAEEISNFYAWQNRLDQLAMLEDLRQYTADGDTLRELGRRIAALREAIEREPYVFDRRFIFRILAMGHSQFAEYIGARGPNTQVNAACASTAQAVAVAEDWIRAGRCRRVIVIGADNVTSDHLLEWVGAGFLATGAAATDSRVDQAALPFDRRRHGTLLGMGACALVVEAEDAVRERGMRGIVELLSSETSNSAFHGTRLDVEHISMVMENLVVAAERRFGLNRYAVAPQTVFMSHETFTPARGGSASAEVVALRKTFGEAANDIIVANTKGFTGHPMGVGVEDVIAIKALEYGIVPPVPNFREVDPDLGVLNLSRGGRYPVQYALHLAAGFGSQIAMTLSRRIPGGLDRIDHKDRYARWLADISGYDNAEAEVVKRILRVKANGAPGRTPVGSSWQYGVGPSVRAAAPGDGIASSFAAAYRPAPLASVAQLLGSKAPGKETAADHRPAVVEPSVPAALPAPVTARSTVPDKSSAPVPANAASPSQPLVAEPATIPPPVPIPPAVDAMRPVSAPANGGQPPAVTPAVDAAGDPVKASVLEIVAAKTGYPQDMLDLDLDLEADLGIDTVKQAETFAAIREAFDIPLQEGISLRNYPTLNHVIGFVRTSRPDLAAEPTTDSRPQTAQPTTDSRPQTGQMAAVPDAHPAVDTVKAKVLEIVAAKTGYPQDMLELDLDLEADLGVDTVKQAETFAAIREAFAIPLQEGISLRDYPTLKHVIGFVYAMRPDLAEEPTTENRPPTEAMAAVPDAHPAVDTVKAKVLEIVAAKTGYPEDMLELDLDLEADLGVDTVKQAETFAAIREAYGIPIQEGLSLRDYPTLNHVIAFVHTVRPDLAAEPASDNRPPTEAMAAVPDAHPAVDTVKAKVLEIVAAKTGYPEDMLELDLDLEADLGVDTVKQAETFAAIREAYGIPIQEGLSLRDYPTLNHVIAFVHTMRPDLAAEPATDDRPQAAAAVSGGQPRAATRAVVPIGSLEEADTMPRRAPVPVLRPGLDLCKATGVSLDSGSRVVVMMDRGGVGKALLGRLHKLGVTTLALEPDIEADELDRQLQTWLAAGRVQGVYWLPALDVEPDLEDLELSSWRELNRQRVKNLYRTMRSLYESIAGAGAFLVSATRLGGLHGYGPEGASAPLGGAVTGFTKAYGIEKRLRGHGEGLVVKAVDFEVHRKTAEPAEQLIAETLFDPGVVEVGYYEGLRYGISLAEQPARDGNPGMVLDRDTVFVVTGAAGGITSAIVTDLAAASGGVFYLLDLVACPPPGDANVGLFRSDREALKAKLIEEARTKGEKPTPKQIDQQIAGIERSEAALRAVEAVEGAGGAARYFSLDLRDGAAVALVMDEIRERHGRIDVLLHAGGLLMDRTLPNKEPQQFDLVFDVKADGFFSLLRAAKGLPIGATVVFSSVAGRFGNDGQSDYAAANDLLCKVSSSMRRWRPETRAIAIDWTAWGQIGMASRGAVPQIMEALGIDMLPPAAGVPTIRRELTYGGTRGEIVVAGRLGAWGEERDPQGGLDPAKAASALATRHPRRLMVGEVKAARLYGGLEIETTLDPHVQPFLYDHAPDEGTPWLPGVMAVEAMAEVAGLLAPGYRVASVEKVEMLGAFKFFRMEPRTLYLRAEASPCGGGELLGRVTLSSVTKPTKEGLPAQAKTHFTAMVRLRPESAKPAPLIAFDVPATGVMPVTAPEIYGVFFHGPAYQVIERGGANGGSAIALFARGLPDNSQPADAASLMAPRLVELCFQTAALWSVRTKSAMAFPLGIGSVTVYRQEDQAGDRRLYCLCSTHDDGATFDAQVVDDTGVVYVDLRGYQTVSR